MLTQNFSQFVGDGPPRRSIHRPWDRSLPSMPDMSTWSNICNQDCYQDSDDQHLQSRAFAGRFGNVQISRSENQFFCFCRETWRQLPHRCWSTSYEKPSQPLCIYPRHWLPRTWIYRDNPINEMNYLDDLGMVAILPLDRHAGADIVLAPSQ